MNYLKYFLFILKKVLFFHEKCCFFEIYVSILHIFTILLFIVNYLFEFRVKPRIFLHHFLGKSEHFQFKKSLIKFASKFYFSARKNIKKQHKMQKSYRKTIKKRAENRLFYDVFYKLLRLIFPILVICIVLHNELQRAKCRIYAQQNYSLHSI